MVSNVYTVDRESKTRREKKRDKGQSFCFPRVQSVLQFWTG